jgi:hypothetical protein
MILSGSRFRSRWIVESRSSQGERAENDCRNHCRGISPPVSRQALGPKRCACGRLVIRFRQVLFASAPLAQSGG